MEDWLARLGSSLQWLGGGVAMAFIVVIAAGILAMTLVYVGSALLVLDRFARVSTGWASPAVAGLLTSVFLAVITTISIIPPDSVFSGAEWRATFIGQLGWMLAFSLISLVVMSFAIRSFSRRSLAGVATLFASFGAGLALSGTGNLVLAPVLSGFTFSLVAVLWVFRRSRKRREVFAVERLLRMSAIGSAPGALIALFLPALGQAATLVSTGLLLGGGVAVVLGLLPLAVAGCLKMRKSVEWFIAIRYLVARRRQVFISAISAICVSGIAVGVWLIIVVLSVMNGFEQTWRDEILGNRAHFTVHDRFGPFVDHEEMIEIVEAISGVEAASPYLDAEGMVRGQEGQIASVRLRGIDAETVGKVTDLENDLQPIEGEGTANLARRFASIGDDGETPGIVIGGHLAVSMGLGIGDRLHLISPFGGPPTPLGPGPRLKRFEVVGIFHSSFYQYDEAFTYTTLEAARDFRKTGDVVDGIEVRTTDHYRSQIVGTQVQQALGYPFYTRDWKEVFP
ncbi:MAG: ABC transporter permease, partial [Myxococcota bacterium]